LRSWPAAGKAKELFFPFAVLRRYAIIALVFKKSIFFSKLLERALSPASRKHYQMLVIGSRDYGNCQSLFKRCQGPHQRLLYHPFKVLVALLFLSKHKNLFCLDDKLNGMANNTHRPHAELEK
jgi:hypothetical protein